MAPQATNPPPAGGSCCAQRWGAHHKMRPKISPLTSQRIALQNSNIMSTTAEKIADINSVQQTYCWPHK